MKQRKTVAGAAIANVDITYGGLARVPLEGEEQFSKRFSIQLGGGGAATLINLKRLNIPVQIQTFLGNDPISDYVRNCFASYGVTPENLYHGSDVPINVTTAMVTERDRTFCTYIDMPTVTERLTDAIYHGCRDAKIVLMNEWCPDAYRRLKDAGAYLVFDSGWDDALGFEKYHELLELADLYTPNRKEACKLTGEDSPERAASVLERYFTRVIVKLDSDGCLVREKGQSRIIPSIPNVQAVDSIGAGDAFLAGLIYGLYHERPIDECVLFGNLTGAKSVTGVGCLSAWYTEEELLAMEQKYRYLLPA